MVTKRDQLGVHNKKDPRDSEVETYVVPTEAKRGEYWSCRLHGIVKQHIQDEALRRGVSQPFLVSEALALTYPRLAPYVGPAVQQTQTYARTKHNQRVVLWWHHMESMVDLIDKQDRELQDLEETITQLFRELSGMDPAEFAGQAPAPVESRPTKPVKVGRVTVKPPKPKPVPTFEAPSAKPAIEEPPALEPLSTTEVGSYARQRRLRQEGFQKGYRGLDLDDYVQNRM